MKVGKTKQRMAKMLSEQLGTTIDPNDFWANYNAEKVGCARWGVWAIINGESVHVYSWDTMTECVKKGFVFSKERDRTVCVVVNDPA